MSEVSPGKPPLCLEASVRLYKKDGKAFALCQGCTAKYNLAFLKRGWTYVMTPGGTRRCMVGLGPVEEGNCTTRTIARAVLNGSTGIKSL